MHHAKPSAQSSIFETCMVDHCKDSAKLIQFTLTIIYIYHFLNLQIFNNIKKIVFRHFPIIWY